MQETGVGSLAAQSVPLSKRWRKFRKELRRKFEGKLQQVYYKWNVQRYYRSLRKRVGAADSDFNAYLQEQLEHTLEKKRLFGRDAVEAFPLIEILAEQVNLAGKHVLCVGARNTDEIICFRKKNVGRVVGVDLYSDHRDILVMDMHDLKFPDGSFDIIYCRHAYEHAYDKRKAAREFVRVARPGGLVVVEVPGNYKGGADVNVFTGLDDLKAPFEGLVDGVAYEEFSRKEENTDKMDILRVMMRVPSARMSRG